jgi:uncharacterized protein
MKDFRPYKAKSAGELSIKDIDTSKRTVMGYFASFNTLDSDGDIFAPGAFTKSLTENRDRIMHLLQHDPMRPIGRPSVLKEDGQGLYFETPIAQTELGDDVLQLYIDGVYNEHSVGFQLIKSHTASQPPIGGEGGANIITDAKLWEGSTVTWGANQNTPFIGVKFLESAMKRKGILEKALHRGNLCDATYYKLQIELQQLLTLLETNPAPAPSRTMIRDTHAAGEDETDARDTELVNKLSTITFN